MKTQAQPKRLTPFPRAKIAKCVADIMPEGGNFKLRVAESGLPDLKVVHVVTEAWNRQPNTDRIFKVIKAVRPSLTEAENDRILHFSVLTPTEYAETVRA